MMLRNSGFGGKQASKHPLYHEDENESNTINWPEADKQPASEFGEGYFSKAFPTLFWNGKGDPTSSRLIKVSVPQAVEHLLKSDRRFANHPLFVMVVTSMIEKREALKMGNLYHVHCILVSAPV